ncbi:MAG: hypothetical protein HKM29_04610 [Deltaproteobacteria bacterium]|nr:hypothetical protein [Deltaproteobacteria bacterium]NNG46194.1 hypothetical protein [Deltaproteobacteria bacterium]
MKGVKVLLILVLGALVSFGLSGTAMAFHAGGVAHCDGCHTMHNSQDGATIIPGTTTLGTGINSFLLVGSDPSSTCLSCHVRIYRSLSDGSTTAANTYVPGGDFWWINQVTPANDRGGTVPAAAHGHNTIALDFTILQDNVLTSGPSNGSVNYQAAWLGCNSCHDPHGKIANNLNPLPISGSGSYGEADGTPAAGSMFGNYRILGGVGYDGGGQASGIAFANAAPIAEAYHGSRGQWPAETDTNHVDYGAGMSEWCVNCHSGFDADGSQAHRHPASNDAHLNGFSSAYNSYVATGDLTGAAATAFDRLVPFERGITDPFAAGLDHTQTVGPDSNSNVMCVTCHRAHATAFPDALRWDPNEELIAHSVILNEAYGIHAYYGETPGSRYNDFQRSLCNKCHLQD